MAGRQREQRLQAVYDAFDARNYKGVIKLTNAAIQKYPDAAVFRSLKAVALERTGRLDEALQLVEDVLAEAPPDDHALNMLLLVLKPANRVADLQAAYEAACAKQPANEELLQGLFASHVRCFNFREQQQVATRLNKLHPSELHQWWVVCSLALQAHEAGARKQLGAFAPEAGGAEAAGGPAAAAAGGLGAGQVLQLAEAMAARLLARQGGGAASWEAAMLYLGLLQAQGKHDAALAAVRGPLGGAISLPAERRQAEAALLLAKGELGAAASLYEAALSEQPDDWAALLLYLDCLLPATASTMPAIACTGVAQVLTGAEASPLPHFLLGGVQALVATMTAGDTSGGPSLQERLARAEAFVGSLPETAPPEPEEAATDGNATSEGEQQQQQQQQQQQRGARPLPLLRGPPLARVELAKRRLQLGLGADWAVADALLEYHRRLGHVVSCAMDVGGFLPLLGAATRAELSEQLEAQAGQLAEELQHLRASGGGASQQLKLVRRQMAARQIQADLGGPSFAGPGAASAHARALMARYAAAQPLYSGLDVRERGPADELLWLAAAALVDAAALEQQQQQQQQQQQPGADAGAGAGAVAHLLQALLVLEAGVNGRPYCAPARLGLAALHGLLGNAPAAAHHFGVLDVKHIQHDTLSAQHLLPLLLGLGAEGAAAELLAATRQLFEDHMRDAGDTLMQAFRSGTHTKVLEFVCFKERLERSHTYALARAEAALLRVRQAASGEEAAAAAAAAASALPLSLLDGDQWRGMRFNDDLATRLPWMPPVPGPRHLVVLLWWEQLAAQAAPRGCCWWQRVAAAEVDLQPAAQLRAAMRASAQQRWLLPHLLAAATRAGPQHTDKAAAADAQFPPAPLGELLQRYVATLGSGGPDGLWRELGACFPAAGAEAGQPAAGTPLSRQLQLLDAAMFMLAQPVQELLAALQEHAALDQAVAAACQAVSQRAELLSRALLLLQRQVCALLQPARAHLGCLLPGDGLSAAALLVGESCTWALVSFEAWGRAAKQAKGRRKPKAKQQQSGGASPAAQQLLQEQPAVAGALAALDGARSALVSALGELAAAAGRAARAAADAGARAALLASTDPSSCAGVRELVGWEERLAAQQVAASAAEAQAELARQLRERAAGLAGRAAAAAGLLC